MKVFFILAFSLHIWAVQASYSLHIKGSLLKGAEKRRLIDVIKQIEKRMPRTMKKGINRPIQLVFKQLNKEFYPRINPSWFGCDKKSKSQVSQEQFDNTKSMGHIPTGFFVNPRTIKTIFLDHALAKSLVEKDRKISCGHQSTKRYAKAVIYHELAHLYDLSNKKVGIEKRYLRYCRQFDEDELKFKPACRSFLKGHRSISGSPYFLNMAGWIHKGLIVKRRVNLNHAKSRSPDPYEFYRPEETFAVNFEYFMLDPALKCRRPSMYQYFENVLRYRPFAKHRCQFNTKVSINSQTSGLSPLLRLQIDPDRIYQVHYLFAGRGKSLEGRWGHATLRLVMCPSANKRGEHCLYDTSDDVILSFRANVEDLALNYFKGLDGSYDSQMFIQTVADVVNEYTKGEFRDIVSLPIKMKREEMKALASRALEIYWSYRGKYFFLTNNCATEAINLLKVAKMHDFDFQNYNALSPLGFYKDLQKKGLIDLKLLDDRKSAIAKTYFFPAYDQKLDESFQTLKRFQKRNKLKEFSEYALKLTAKERLSWLKMALKSDPGHKVSLHAHFLRMENVILSRLEIKSFKSLAQLIFDPKERINEDSKIEIKENLLSVRELLKELMPEYKIQNGYGIPLMAEFQDIHPAKAKAVSAEIQTKGRGLKSIAEKLIPDLIKEYRQTRQNRLWSKQLMLKALRPNRTN